MIVARRKPSKQDLKAARRLAENEPKLSRRARVRLGELVAEFEPQRLVAGSMLYEVRGGATHGPEIESFGEAAPRILRRTFGQEIVLDPSKLKTFCLEGQVVDIVGFLMGAASYVRDLDAALLTHGGAFPRFVDEINEIMEEDKFPLYLDGDEIRWRQRIESDLELLRCTLLANPADMAECKQGDPQVEMVVSTVQPLLTRKDPVIVDYGAGLGRVLVGFGGAGRFRNATYIAVDEPVEDDVRALANSIGARFIERTRTEFLARPDHADVIIMMNTLHHIPLRELPRQLATLLRALKPGGVLVIQEIGELREPEQVNVPWVIEDIIELLAMPGCETNPRSTMTRSTKTPLTHMLVRVDGEPPGEDALSERVRVLWAKMKRRAIDDLKRLFKSRNAEDQRRLHYVLIANANLDLNDPPTERSARSGHQARTQKKKTRNPQA